VLDDADGHELLSGVAALLHEAASQTLDDGAGGLAESLLLVATGGVGEERGVVTGAGDVVLFGTKVGEKNQQKLCVRRKVKQILSRHMQFKYCNDWPLSSTSI